MAAEGQGSMPGHYTATFPVIRSLKQGIEQMAKGEYDICGDCRWYEAAGYDPGKGYCTNNPAGWNGIGGYIKCHGTLACVKFEKKMRQVFGR